MHVPKAVEEIVDLVRRAGGRALLVGGAVVDHLMNIQPKDWDLEVYGLEFPELQKMLESADLNPKLVGREFGVLKINGGLDIDVSIPRRDNKTGAGHKDFEVALDPNMTPKEAARRRDLSINSIFYDLDSQEIIDPFGGYEDLKNGVMKATDPYTFVEDPLRVLRIMQLLPRKGKVVEPATMELCRGLSETFNTLAGERVMVEFEKLLLKAAKPSVGLRFLQDAGWLKHFPELYDLVDCPQNPEHHPEGDAWEHTLAVLDNAATVRPWIPEDWQLAFMLGCLLHDVGKPETTDRETFTAYGHDKASEPLAKAFMRRLTSEKELVERVCALARNHMQPYFLNSGKAKASAWRRLHNKVRIDVLGWVSLCDKAASEPEILFEGHSRSRACWKYFVEFGCQGEPIKPKLMGRHLIDAGLKPGPEFGKILKVAYEAQLDDDSLDVEQLLKLALEV